MERCELGGQSTKSGREIIVESRWTLINEPNGTPKSILVINTNITDRKDAEEKIQEQAALLGQGAGCDFRVRSFEETITYWNQGATRLSMDGHQERSSGQDAQHAPSSRMRRLIGLAFAMPRFPPRGEWFGELYQVTRAIGKRSSSSRAVKPSSLIPAKSPPPFSISTATSPRKSR